MGRKPRQLSDSGFYHIVFRGVNHQHLFEDNSDFQNFLQMLSHIKTKMGFEIHAYCLMSNHVHLLIREIRLGDISQIMKRLLTKYAMYFNQKYKRSGALIANRYKSQPIQVDEYFIPLIRYIHQNPIKAGIVNNLEDYRYSSYREYLHGAIFADTTFSLSLIGKTEWLYLHQIPESDIFEVSGKMNMDDEQIRRIILQHTKGINPFEIAALPKVERNTIIHELKEKQGLSIRQIERATGISRGIVSRC